MEFFASAITTLQTLVVALAWACGALSICWRATARTTLAPMLMCHKVTHKNLIDSHPYSVIFRTHIHFRNVSEIFESFRERENA